MGCLCSKQKQDPWKDLIEELDTLRMDVVWHRLAELRRWVREHDLSLRDSKPRPRFRWVQMDLVDGGVEEVKQRVR